jgi:L-alanine-DL-glutamate epimerase-like enolase superfamily enzyme
MKVTAIELTVLEHLVVVTVKTDEGLEGHGFAQKGRSVAEALAEVVRPQVLGEDPFDYEKIWQKMLDRDRWGGGLPHNAYGAVDVALWDIIGQAAGKPLYKLLGGCRERVKAYYTTGGIADPEEQVKVALAAKEAGFTAYKLHPKGGYDRDLASCKAVRQALGEEMRIMSDPVATYNHQEALRMGRELEKLNYYWYEEPLMDPDIEGYVELSRALDIPVAGTEWAHGGLWGLYSTPQYLVRKAVDIVRSDVSWKGGITGLLKTFHLCEAFGVNCEVHTAMMSLMDVANLHVICAKRNCEYFEYAGPFKEGIGFGLKSAIRIDAEGYVSPPDAPGLGVELDWDILDKHTIAKL